MSVTVVVQLLKVFFVSFSFRVDFFSVCNFVSYVVSKH